MLTLYVFPIRALPPSMVSVQKLCVYISSRNTHMHVGSTRTFCFLPRRHPEHIFICASHQIHTHTHIVVRGCVREEKRERQRQRERETERETERERERLICVDDLSLYLTCVAYLQILIITFPSLSHLCDDATKDACGCSHSDTHTHTHTHTHTF
jgi:hypothetical protein